MNNRTIFSLALLSELKQRLAKANQAQTAQNPGKGSSSGTSAAGIPDLNASPSRYANDAGNSKP
ncbi:hypothetical protein Taro_047540 [Colocasia esculenta]|uniref:Uncharacterized protein n=1 Tax=Colocasia esculenta TaxID=4460 RepID=A0A843X177_COLES|nr:hypothetical protein [Colocasia esculenta]